MKKKRNYVLRRNSLIYWCPQEDLILVFNCCYCVYPFHSEGSPQSVLQTISLVDQVTYLLKVAVTSRAAVIEMVH